MSWLATQITVRPELLEGWLLLMLLLAVCCWIVKLYRATLAFIILALVPALVPALQPVLAELKSYALNIVPWYVLAVIAFFLVFITIRCVIALFLGNEIANRTTSDLLTVTILGTVRILGRTFRYIGSAVAEIIRR